MSEFNTFKEWAAALIAQYKNQYTLKDGVFGESILVLVEGKTVAGWNHPHGTGWVL